MITGTRRALTHSNSAERKERRPPTPAAISTAGAGTGIEYQPSARARSAKVISPSPGEVVDAGRAPARDRRRQCRGDVVVMAELEGDAGVGEHRAQEGERWQRLHRPSHERKLCPYPHRPQRLLDQLRRPPAGDDRGAEDVGIRGSAAEDLHQQRLQLGLLRRVVEALAAAGWHLLGQRLRVVTVEAVGSDRGRVDQPRRPGRPNRLEHVAAPLEVDPAGFLVAAEDDEGEVNGDVGVGEEGVEGGSVEDVPLAIADLLPSLAGGVEGTAGHPEHAPDLLRSLESREQGLADLAGRPGYRNCQRHGFSLGVTASSRCRPQPARNALIKLGEPGDRLKGSGRLFHRPQLLR